MADVHAGLALDPDPAWPGLFAREAQRMRTALERALQIEHVGSTSVRVTAHPLGYGPGDATRFGHSAR